MRVRQLLAGRDFARSNAFASQMANFVYLVEDEATKQCAIVDAAWEIDELLGIIRGEGLTLAAGLVTHTHFDHAGGSYAGAFVEGVAELAARTEAPIWVHPAEAGRLVAAGVPEARLRAAEDGVTCPLGEGVLRFHHTPGHTPGAVCIEAGDALVTGDTLFVGECGRIDLEGSDPRAMYRSLQKLKAMRPELVVYPGHDYGSTPTSTIGRERVENRWMNTPPDAFER